MLVFSHDDGAQELALGLQRDLLGRVERETWLPHVTVLRFRERPRLRPNLPDLGPVVTSEAAAFLSVLRPSGAEYVVLESVRLGGSRVDREQALETALGQIERNFGKGAVMKMNDRAAVSVGAVSTGSLALDLALGIGGLPRGRIVEIFGPESSGKTTLVYHVIAEAQRRGGICAFIDAEHAMDPAYAKKIGVDIDNLLVSQPDTGEQALEITELLIRSGALDVVAIDSVAALTPKAEIEGEMGDSHVGLQARLMSQALRKLAGTLNRTDTICLFTNQLREKIGVMFGSPETTPGGRALKFYSSVRLDIRRIETLKDGVEAIGNRVRVKVVKNKVAPPFKQAEFDIIYGLGIPWEGTVLDAAIERKAVQKSGSYFSFGDERLGQGRHNATAFLREHPDVTQQILAALQVQIGPDQVVSARLLPTAATGGRREGARRGCRRSVEDPTTPSRQGPSLAAHRARGTSGACTAPARTSSRGRARTNGLERPGVASDDAARVSTASSTSRSSAARRTLDARAPRELARLGDLDDGARRRSRGLATSDCLHTSARISTQRGLPSRDRTRGNRARERTGGTLHAEGRGVARTARLCARGGLQRAVG